MVANVEKTARFEIARRYLVFALYAFAVFGWELVVMLLLDPLWGGSFGGTLMHWAVTAAGWFIGVIVIVRLIRDPGRAIDRTFGGSLRGNTPLRVVGVVVAVVLAIGVRVLVLQEWKPLGEYERLSAVQGTATPFAFALLIIYYLCETAVILLVITLGQRAGEMRFGAPAVPWGGLVLACTWGATHILLQGPAAGIYAMSAAVLYGCIYSLGRRRSVLTYVVVAAAFIL